MINAVLTGEASTSTAEASVCFQSSYGTLDRKGPDSSQRARNKECLPMAGRPRTYARFRLGESNAHAGLEAHDSNNKGLLAPDVNMREALGAYAEHLFNQLRGEALVIAALAYGLQLNLSVLRKLRVRDVRLTDNVIVAEGLEREIPIEIQEDVQEHMRSHCGEAQSLPSLQVMNAPLFSRESFLKIEHMLLSLEREYEVRLNYKAVQNRARCSNVRLRILGWFHKRRAQQVAGGTLQSALELFDKGPRINRRKTGGVQDTYYVWRLSRVVSW